MAYIGKLVGAFSEAGRVLRQEQRAQGWFVIEAYLLFEQRIRGLEREGWKELRNQRE